MLPKLAELWKGRRVIYFVATNHIKFFDPAIRRAERFDTLVDVSPPSFEKKIKQLGGLLDNDFRNNDGTEVMQAEVERALMRVPRHEAASAEARKDLPRECSLAKFLLIRWDQLNELAALVRKKVSNPRSVVLTADLSKSVLSEFSEPSLMTCEAFIEYRESRQYQQYDFSKISVWTIKGLVPQSSKEKFET